MQVIKNGEILDLKEKQIEIDNTSPIFNMKGTQSVNEFSENTQEPSVVRFPKSFG